MGLALCHTVPRDRLLQLVTLMLVVAFCLLAASVGERNKDGSYATLKGADNTRLYVDGRAIDSSGITLCSEDLKEGECYDFVIKTRIAGLLVILGWVTLTLAILASCFLITPLSRHSYQIYLFFWIAISIPVALVVAGGAMYLGPALSKALDLPPTGKDVHYGRSLRCILAAMALMIVSFLIATFQLVSTLGRSRIKQSHVEGRKIDEIMKMHIVNDDWKRQKMMWVKHAQAVDIELQENQVQGEDNSSAAASMEPDQVTYKHTRTRSQAATEAISFPPQQHFTADE